MNNEVHLDYIYILKVIYFTRTDAKILFGNIILGQFQTMRDMDTFHQLVEREIVQGACSTDFETETVAYKELSFTRQIFSQETMNHTYLFDSAENKLIVIQYISNHYYYQCERVCLICYGELETMYSFTISQNTCI